MQCNASTQVAGKILLVPSNQMLRMNTADRPASGQGRSVHAGGVSAPRMQSKRLQLWLAVGVDDTRRSASARRKATLQRDSQPLKSSLPTSAHWLAWRGIAAFQVVAERL